MSKLIVLLMVVTVLLSGCYTASNNVLRSHYDEELSATDSIAVLSWQIKYVSHCSIRIEKLKR
jgi:uncharacterized protein YceK